MPSVLNTNPVRNTHRHDFFSPPRKGSVIIEHIVVYDVSRMTPSNLEMTADQLYEKTVGPAVTSGSIGSLGVEECPSCTPPSGRFLINSSAAFESIK